MWIMSRTGFFSVVAHRDDPALVLVRARDLGQLKRLSAENPTGPFEIVETPHADYPVRTTLTKDRFETIVTWLARSIDYDNFKNAVHVDPDCSDDYHDFLGKVWSAGRRMSR
jgi:hypothetical protein